MNGGQIEATSQEIADLRSMVDRSTELVSSWKARAEAAEAQRDRLGAVLRKHHDWHQRIGIVGVQNDDQNWHELDLSDAYADGSLCEETVAALHALPQPRGG